MNLSIDYEKLLTSKSRKVLTRRLVVCSAIALNLMPLLFKDVLNSNAKLALALSGFVTSLCCLKLPDYEYEQKLIDTYEKTSMKEYKLVLQGEVVKTQAKLEINNQQDLAKTIEHLPEHQIDYFAQKYGVVPILAKYYIDNDSEENETVETVQPVVTTSKSIFENVIEKIEKGDSISLAWLKKAITESCFVAGKKGSGKSHLLRWLLAGFIAQSSDKDLFYVIDKHYDSDSPWVFGVDEAELVKRGRIVDGKKAIAKISELHDSLLNRIENGLTYKKIGSHVRVIIDEIDSYPDEEMEIISAFAKDVEYQGRKFGFSIHLGAHSIKKGEMGIDSSILGSMLNILYPSVVLDRNSVLSGAFPTVQVMKRMIERYKAQAPKDSRVVVIGDDFEVFVSHVPKLELVQITVDSESVESVEKPSEKPSMEALLNQIITWCKACKEKYGRYPTVDHLKVAWRDISKQELDDKGMALLREYLYKSGGIEI
jgi:hypothetical protein